MHRKTLLLTILFVAITVSFTGCPKGTKKTKQPTQDMVEEIDKMPGLLDTSTETVTELDIRGPEFINKENLLPVHFDFDRYNLSEEARKILQKNAEILKSHKEWEILVEGHCDERGTIEYNLALGQKRAKEVKDYYVRIGVQETSLGTISFGEEKPVCTEQTENCWAKNRRAETKVRLK